MAYDSTRDKTVLFGGDYKSGTTETYYGDTWEWDGSSWRMRSSSGPSKRTGAVMAYDSARGKTVLFGGRTRDNNHGLIYYGDTWEWDGVSWKQVATSGPSKRSKAVMAYDSAQGKTVLFGGYGGAGVGYYNDTWEWDGASWKQVFTSGPDARSEAVMAYDSARRKTVLFGGSDVSYYGDMWEYAPLGAEPYTLSEAIAALRVASGIQSLTAPQLSRLDVVSEGTSFKRVDMADAVRIARMVSGAE